MSICQILRSWQWMNLFFDFPSINGLFANDRFSAFLSRICITRKPCIYTHTQTHTRHINQAHTDTHGQNSHHLTSQLIFYPSNRTEPFLYTQMFIKEKFFCHFILNYWVSKQMKWQTETRARTGARAIMPFSLSQAKQIIFLSIYFHYSGTAIFTGFFFKILT